jgi:hypothetical protein
MTLFAIIETDSGLTVAEAESQEGPEEIAVRHGGLVVDPGPYRSYEDAFEALLALDDADDEGAERG